MNRFRISKAKAQYILVLLAMVFVCVVGLSGQLGTTPPNFQPKQTIPSATFNTLFTQIDARALNRTGGTMTGNLIFSPDNSLDIGASGATRPRDVFIADDLAVGDTVSVTGATTLAGLSATTGTFSSTLGVTGLATLSGGATVTGTVTATTFSGSGASLTSIPETAITDGSLLSRVADAETFSGIKTFSAAPVLNNTIALNTKNSAATTVNLASLDGSNNYLFGSGNAAQVTNTVLAAGSAIDFQTGGVSRANIDGAGTFNHLGGVTFASAISPAALASGSTNDYSPTNLTSAFVLRLTPNGGGSTLTGIAAQAAGSLKTVCNIGGGTLTVGVDNGSSTAANRITGTSLGDRVLSAGGCVVLWYDGTSSRWRILAEMDS